MKIYPIIVVLLIVHVTANTNAHNCKNTNGACLPDCLLIDGLCQPCFGSWGINCTQNCRAGYYGFGCRSQCSCYLNQSCDERVGCIDNLPRDHDQDKSSSRVLCDTLLAISICTGSLCLILVFYILCKRLCSPNQTRKRVKLDYKEQDVTGTLNLHPTSSNMNYLSQNSVPLIKNQASSSSSCGRIIQTIPKSPKRRVGHLNRAEVPISVRQDFLNRSGTMPVYNQFYDKCQRKPDEYVDMAMDVSLPRRTALLSSSENETMAVDMNC